MGDAELFSMSKGGNRMVPTTNENLIIPIDRKSVESIADWFDQQKNRFYPLGWTYVKTQRQMEELFYRSIMKVHKELHRLKGETDFESWVTSIFIHICREFTTDISLLASEENNPHNDLFQALDQLNMEEKEALVLTYVSGFPYEKAAHLLQVSVEKLKELLFSGIQSLRKELGYGSTFHGCKEYQKDYTSYLDRTMERSKKIEFEIHVYHCQNCQEDLGTFQDVRIYLTEQSKELPIPTGFMKNIKARLAEKEKKRRQKIKKRNKWVFIFAVVCTLIIGIGFFTGTFANLYYTWTVEDQELLPYLQHDFGEMLNLEAESNGVKVKIKSAISDEFQTLIFYEIEDTEADNQYAIMFGDGVFVENEIDLMNTDVYPLNYPPDLESAINKEKKNVYHGKMGLFPIREDNGTIKLVITQLMKLNDASSNPDEVYDGNYKTGEWEFEIPVKKLPTKQFALVEKIEVEGVPMRFDKLIIAPTATILQYSINPIQPEKNLSSITFDNLVVNNKKVIADLYGGAFIDAQEGMDWSTYQAYFEPFFGKKPKEVKAQLKEAFLTVEDQKIVELDPSQNYPQTFAYAGSTITIEKVEIGNPSKVVISDDNIENRTYETLNLGINGDENIEMGMKNDSVIVDKNGNKYDPIDDLVKYEEIEQPRYFVTKYDISLQSDKAGEEVVPKRLEIYGYNTTKYLNDVVKISLD